MIEVKNLKKIYYDGKIATHVLRGINIKIEKGEFVAIMGKSGAGKSTLLYQISLLDHPTTGNIVIGGIGTETLNANARSMFRLEKFGYVFQDYALLPELTAIENVALPLMMQGHSLKNAKEISRESIKQMGLSSRENNFPAELSGGEQQRISIARAIAHNPEILFADEPTASLDTQASQVVIDIFRALNKKGQTIVMITHELEYGKQADRIITLKDGELVS